MGVVNLAVLSFDGVNLLLPQHEVATIEVVNSIIDENDTPGAFGTLKSAGREWPVFALTSDFEKQLECPSNYKFCVGINYVKQAEAFSIACEEVNTLKIENASELKSVHTCMRTPECPIEALVLKDGQLLLMSDVATMRRYLMPEAGV